MSTLQKDVEFQLDISGGVISRRQHPKLARIIDWLAATKRLVPLLPGVYARPTEAGDIGVRLRAVNLWDPDAVIVGRGAARLGYWPDLSVGTITIATKRRIAPQPGFALSRRVIPPELIVTVGSVRYACPALAAIDLAVEFESGDPIDKALQTGATDLESMHTALAALPFRRDNPARTLVLLDSRDKPWSAAERKLHRILRGGGVVGWITNHQVWIGKQRYFLDVAFRRLKIAIEVDGFEFHTTTAAFERDRYRQNQLVLEGWLVLRFTWTMITKHPEEVLEVVRRAIRTRNTAAR